MRLPLDIRRQLHQGPTEFDWPLPTDPHKGKVYRLQTDAFEWTFVVVAVEVVGEGWRVCARLHSDPIRLLAKKSGYTDTYALSLRIRDGEGDSEPEAVDEVAQRRITDDANAARSTVLVGLSDQLAEAYATIERVHQNPAAKSIRAELWQARGRVAAAQGKLHRQAAA